VKSVAAGLELISPLHIAPRRKPWSVAHCRLRARRYPANGIPPVLLKLPKIL